MKYYCKVCNKPETWATVGPVYHACPALPAGTGRMTELVPVRPKQRKPWAWALDMVAAGWYCWPGGLWQFCGGVSVGPLPEHIARRDLKHEEENYYRAEGELPPPF